MADQKPTVDNEKCIFCELAKGNVQFDGTFWEDENYVAFLSWHPNTEGFSVVIPRKHLGSDVLAMPDEELQGFIIAAKKVSRMLMNYFPDVGRVGLIMEGMDINHAHIKLVPMHGTGRMKQGEWKQNNSSEEVFMEQYPGFITSVEGPKEDSEKLRELAKGIREANKEAVS